MSALKIGLKVRQKNIKGSTLSGKDKHNAIFGDEESEDENHDSERKTALDITTFNDTNSNASRSISRTLNNRPAGNTTSMSRPSKSNMLIEPGIDLSTHRFQHKKIEEAEAIDSSIYDYDAAYDAIHAKLAANKAAERADAEQRKPKYMTNLLEAAEIRKRDQLRAKDKLLQREREAEGDDFADKEKFVTSAYKQQQEEVRRLAEEERLREDQEEARRRIHGMRGFYQNVMQERERKHQGILEAAAEGVGSSGADVQEQPEKTTAQIAHEMNAQGASIVINEEGQVADKRQLLTAGLNVIAKPKTTSAEATRARDSAETQDYHEIPFLRGSTQKAMRERQTRMMEAQLEQNAKRVAEAENGERQKMKRAAKSRKTEADVSSARERYLKRKREAAAATATER